MKVTYRVHAVARMFERGITEGTFIAFFRKARRSRRIQRISLIRASCC